MRLATLAALAALAVPVGGHAAEPALIDVEFNDLQQADTGCRAVFVVKNGMGKPLDKIAFRVVAFDTAGKATLFLSLDLGGLPDRKTRILRFDLGAGTKCADIGRLVLDDVTECAGDAVTPPACLAAVKLSSRTGLGFHF